VGCGWGVRHNRGGGGGGGPKTKEAHVKGAMLCFSVRQHCLGGLLAGITGPLGHAKQAVSWRYCSYTGWPHPSCSQHTARPPHLVGEECILLAARQQRCQGRPL
jgi:hypothetical protein